MSSVHALRSASDVDAAVQFMFPGVGVARIIDLVTHARVVHVAAVHVPDAHDAASASMLRTILVHEATAPKCLHDFFMLNFVRSCVDGIIETGLTVRAEPALHTDIQGPFAAALRAWRASRLPHLPSRATTLVLTRARPDTMLDFAHALFTRNGASTDTPEDERHRVVIFTPNQNLDALHAAVDACAGARASSVAIEIAQSPALLPLQTASSPNIGASPADALLSPQSAAFRADLESGVGLAAAVRHLQTHCGCRTVSLEAGPATTAALYANATNAAAMPEPRDELRVDLLFLGMHRGAIDARALGGAFADTSALHAQFECVSEMHLGDVQPEWSFACYVRRRFAA